MSQYRISEGYLKDFLSQPWTHGIKIPRLWIQYAPSGGGYLLKLDDDVLHSVTKGGFTGILRTREIVAKALESAGVYFIYPENPSRLSPHAQVGRPRIW
jgi:hypothetical protein